MLQIDKCKPEGRSCASDVQIKNFFDNNMFYVIS